MEEYHYITNADPVHRFTNDSRNKRRPEDALQIIKQSLLSFTAPRETNNTSTSPSMDNILKSLRDFGRHVFANLTYTPVKELKYFLRISKWLLLKCDGNLRYEMMIVKEYCRLLDMAIIDSYRYESMSCGRSLYPPEDRKLWKEMVNYCLYMVDCVETMGNAYAIVYALRYFFLKDDTIVDMIRKKRSNIIDMVIRVTRFPKDEIGGLHIDQASLVHWTVVLFEIIGVEKWNGELGGCIDTTCKKFQEIYLKALIETMPKTIPERPYSVNQLERIGPKEMITELFNMVNSYYLVEGESVLSLFKLDSFPNNLDNDKLISISNIILTNHVGDWDELLLNSCMKALLLQSLLHHHKEALKNLCKLISTKICIFLKSNSNEKISSIHYTIVDLYHALKERNSFESYCEHFESDETREFISNTVLSIFLEEYMQSRMDGSFRFCFPMKKCFEAFERSGNLLDKRILTLMVDFGDTKSDLFVCVHEGGYNQVESFFKALAFNIRNRGEEVMSLLDGELCNRLENCLEIFLTSCNDDGWFLIWYQLWDCGLFWNVIEKSRQSETPTFTLSQKFKQEYSLEITKKAACEKPQFTILYILWLFLMENIEESKLQRQKKNSVYQHLVEMSLVRLDYDRGNAKDSSFIILFLAELKGNVQDNMKTIFANMGTIVYEMGEQDNRYTLFVEYCTERILENVDRIVDYAITKKIRLPSGLKREIQNLRGYEKYPYLTERISNKFEKCIWQK